MVGGGAAFAVVGLVTLAIAGLAAASTTSTNSRGPTAGTVGGAGAAVASVGHYSLAASAFAPDSLGDTAEDYANEWNPTTLSNQDSTRCFNAGVALPNGVKISSVTFYYTAGPGPFHGELNRQDLVHHTAVEVASFNSTMRTPTPVYTHTVVTVQANQVVNTTNTYSVGVCPSDATTFSGVTIAYAG